MNVRLRADDFRILEAGAILDESSVAEYVKPMIDGLIESLRTDPAVADFLRLRAEVAAKKAGKLTSLEKRRQHGEGA